MPIPTEPIGSIPRPKALIEGAQAFTTGRLSRDDVSTARETAVEKIRARVVGTALAARALGI